MPRDHTPIRADAVVGIANCVFIDGGHVVITQPETIDASRTALDVRRAISEHVTVHHSDHTMSWCADTMLQCQMNAREAQDHIENVTRESFHAVQTHVVKVLDNMARGASTMDACHYNIIRNTVLTVEHGHADFKQPIQALAIQKCHEKMSTQ